jgi:hypothetical protein
MSRRKKAKAAMPFSPADVANIAKANPYIQRLIEDSKLRDNVRTAIDSTKSAYERLMDGKTPAKALIEDKKLQGDLRHALESVRDATIALTDAPKQRVRKGRRMGRRLMVLALGGGLALAGNEKLRSKVLDTLFGAEEEFQYTPPAGSTPSSSEPATPVSAA